MLPSRKIILESIRKYDVDCNWPSPGPIVIFLKLYILNLFATEQGQIAYELSPTIQDGERIKFSFTVDNGSYTHTDTITKYYRADRFALLNAGTLSGWNEGGLSESWGISDKIYYSPPTSLTDSPHGNYIPKSTNHLTLSNPLVLTGTDSAVLTFRALWDIQDRYDYLAVEVSTDGELFRPLCATHSSAGLPAEVFGHPVY